MKNRTKRALAQVDKGRKAKAERVLDEHYAREARLWLAQQPGTRIDGMGRLFRPGS